MLDNIAVQQVEVAKFLGVLLEQHLSQKYHINHVAKKVSKTIGIISKARFFLLNLCYPYTIHWFTHILTTIVLHGAQRIHPI